MKTPIEISVLISTYMNDNPKHFDRALKSIWSDQIVKPSEIILVIDGEIPPSLNQVIIKWKQKIGPKFKTLFQENNIGLAASLNNGLKLFNGQYIARMDADDISLPNRFKVQKEFLSCNPGIVDLGGVIQEFEDGRNTFYNKSFPLTTEEILLSIPKGSPFAHPTVMIKKNILSRFKYNEHLFLTKKNITFGNEDIDLWFRILSQGYKEVDPPNWTVC